MKTLGSILHVIPSPQFPIRGENGYGGEVDGSKVVFVGVLNVSSIEAAKKIELGDAVDIRWAVYYPSNGWQVSLAYWNDRDEADCFIRRHGVGRWLCRT